MKCGVSPGHFASGLRARQSPLPDPPPQAGEGVRHRSRRYAFVWVRTTRSGVTFSASRCSPIAPAMKRAVMGVPS
jgi:hypothetical protein